MGKIKGKNTKKGEEMNFNKQQVKQALEKLGRANVEQLATELKIELTQNNRRSIFKKIRKYARMIVDQEGGLRDEYDETGQIVYSLK